MPWNRFSSSGLAAAWATLLEEKGLQAAVLFRPRHATDARPFVVESDQMVGDAENLIIEALFAGNGPAEQGSPSQSPSSDRTPGRPDIRTARLGDEE